MLEQYSAAIPQLQAQETYLTYLAVYLGAGGVKPDKARRSIERTLGVTRARPKKVYRPKTAQEHEMLLAAVGIVVE